MYTSKSSEGWDITYFLLNSTKNIGHSDRISHISSVQTLHIRMPMCFPKTHKQELIFISPAKGLPISIIIANMYFLYLLTWNISMAIFHFRYNTCMVKCNYWNKTYSSFYYKFIHKKEPPSYYYARPLAGETKIIWLHKYNFYI